MASKAVSLRIFLVGFFGLSSLLTCGSAWGWGQIGHRTVGQVADHYLLPETKIELSKILQGQTLAQVATWADMIKSDPAWKHTSSYHFQDLPDGQDFLTNLRSQDQAEMEKGGIVEAILQAERDYLHNDNPSDQQIDVKFLIHFVGDIHQPLHAGRPEDLGGNKIPIRWNGFQTNLHAVWDSIMIQDGHRDLFNGAGKKEEVPYANYLIETYGNEPVDQASLNDVNAWLAEDLSFRERLYGDKNLPAKQYSAEFLNVVDHRVYLGGVRLANFLNQMILKRTTPSVRMNLAAAVEQLTGPLDHFIILRRDENSNRRFLQPVAGF
jgi:hypothetical protein